MRPPNLKSCGHIGQRKARILEVEHAAKDTAVAPAIRQIVREARRPIYTQWELALVNAGCNPDCATEAVMMIAALISGYSIRSLWTAELQALDSTLVRLIDCLAQD